MPAPQPRPCLPPSFRLCPPAAALPGGLLPRNRACGTPSSLRRSAHSPCDPRCAPRGRTGGRGQASPWRRFSPAGPMAPEPCPLHSCPGGVRGGSAGGRGALRGVVSGSSVPGEGGGGEVAPSLPPLGTVSAARHQESPWGRRSEGPPLGGAAGGSRTVVGVGARTGSVVNAMPG